MLQDTLELAVFAGIAVILIVSLNLLYNAYYIHTVLEDMAKLPLLPSTTKLSLPDLNIARIHLKQGKMSSLKDILGLSDSELPDTLSQALRHNDTIRSRTPNNPIIRSNDTALLNLLITLHRQPPSSNAELQSILFQFKRRKQKDNSLIKATEEEIFVAQLELDDRVALLHTYLAVD